MIETFVILMWKYNFNNAEMVDTTMKVSNTNTNERGSDRDICHFDVEI